MVTDPAQPVQSPPVPAASPVQMQHTEEVEKQHINQIATQLQNATNNNIDPSSLVPAASKNPLPQFEHPLTQVDKKQPEPAKSFNDSELMDVMEGLQGKPRTAPAANFLKDKVAWMKKKFGEGVQLVKK
ncbi:hypothetical protein HYS97_00840 [Candidatus Daviesbacteria bacterium]|nr:hypothetical protein [Candidatus Daviesbacteria bacterium]